MEQGRHDFQLRGLPSQKPLARAVLLALRGVYLPTRMILEEIQSITTTLNGTSNIMTSTSPKLSGSAWWHAHQANYADSAKVEDLEPRFQSNVRDFLQAMKFAGAEVQIHTTRRNASRTYLMHWAWKIAQGTKSSSVPPRPGVLIQWDHGDDAESKTAAEEMVHLFHMTQAVAPSSSQVLGKAIDMEVAWRGTLMIKNKQGKAITVDQGPRSGLNRALQQVGATYGVLKVAGDPLHWSLEGD
jgi:hypothetical protein